MATASAPASRKSAIVRCTVRLSGVVLRLAERAPGKPIPRVPITPHLRPRVAKARASHWVTEVLPFVPVTPTVHKSSEGRP